MLSINLDKENINQLCEEIVEKIIEKFGKVRVVSVILYGSALAKGDFVPKDLDILILLDSPELDDIFKTREISEGYPAEFFIDYKDYIERKGIECYQRGRHGAYFFVSLAYGKILAGTNYFLENFQLVPERAVQRDLLFRIEEYFY